MSKKLKKIYENTELRKQIGDAVKLAFKNDPTINIRISETMKKRGHNIGDKNGMKNPIAKAKASKQELNYLKIQSLEKE